MLANKFACQCHRLSQFKLQSYYVSCDMVHGPPRWDSRWQLVLLCPVSFNQGLRCHLYNVWVIVENISHGGPPNWILKHLAKRYCFYSEFKSSARDAGQLPIKAGLSRRMIGQTCKEQVISRHESQFRPLNTDTLLNRSGQVRGIRERIGRLISISREAKEAQRSQALLLSILR